MRVHFYCPETGVYQGEGFQEERDFNYVEGCTIIAPPEYSKGEVPVFDVSTKSWIISKVYQNGSGISVIPED